MNISSMGAVSPRYPNAAGISQNVTGGDTRDTEQQIKKLEKERSKLEKQREEEENPFAAQQSEEYANLQKRIEELNKQIQQLKAEAASEKKSTEQQKPDADSNAARNALDTYIPSRDNPEESAGLYRLDKDGEGERRIVLKAVSPTSNFINLT